MNFSIPLNWPRRIPVTPQRLRSNANGFKNDLSINEAVRMLQDELEETGITSAILCCDVEHPTNDRLRRKLSEDSGVCLTFTHNGVAYLVPMDRWYMISHNIYAVSLFIRSIRSIERWGITDMATLLHSFRAAITVAETAQAGNGDENWREELGLGPTATLDDAHAVYRARAKRVSEDQEALTRLNLAIEEARKALS